jgi:DNA-binding response OmpR family regulator
MRALIAEYLSQNEFRVTAVAGGSAMRSVLAGEIVDLVVLDVRLGSDDGMTLTRRLREESAIPIIMLSARSEEADRVMGLELGADDYITKPFSPRELLARIRSVLRRRRAEVRPGRPKGVRAYRFDGCELNLDTRRLMTSEGRLVPLGNAEFNLLVALLGSPQRILTRDRLLDLSRLHNDEVFNRSVDVQIGRLRRKLEKDPAHPRYIRTERGIGYLFALPVETVY